MVFARRLFSDSMRDIDRLLKVFHNGEITKRHVAKELEWYMEEHSFSEKNEAFIDAAVELSMKAIESCLRKESGELPHYEEIDAIIMVSTTGLATPSLEARIMNKLPFSPHTKRIPVWGLGCAGGAAGLTRGYEYCLAFPASKVLVVAVELCSLTFQKSDMSKSNLIGTSLFSDGAAAVLLAGEEAEKPGNNEPRPQVVDTLSTLLEDSLDVMGWDVKDEGLFVVFSKSIPSLVNNWLESNVSGFLSKHGLTVKDIDHFIAHPGGKKVIDAYDQSLELSPGMTDASLKVLREFGNMSSPTVLFVLDEFMAHGAAKSGDIGLVTALGPGFSSELLLVRWT